jgi:hypothetical protein
MDEPSPEQQADYIVRKLEHFITEGKTERGMSFKTWQAMARMEIANAFADAEQRYARARLDLTTRRILMVAASALVTIGFWGAVMAVDKSYGGLAATLIFVAGLVLLAMALEFGVRRALSRLALKNRKRAFGRIEDFDRQLRKLEAELRRKAEKLKAEIGKVP